MATTGSSEPPILRLPDPCLVVLVGPSGSGKSHWADTTFPANRIISSDRLRALVGEHEHDQRAGTDAFAVLDLVLERRLKRRLFTVVDTLGLDATRRLGYLKLARRHQMASVVVAFDTPAAECRARNSARPRPVPAKVLTAQLKSWPDVLAALDGEGFDHTYAPGPVRVVDPHWSTPRPRPDANRRTRCLSSSDFTSPTSPGRAGPPSWAPAWRASPERPRTPGSPTCR